MFGLSLILLSLLGIVNAYEYKTTFSNTDTSKCFFMFSSNVNKGSPCQDQLISIKDLRVCIAPQAGETYHVVNGVMNTKSSNCLPERISTDQKDWFIENLYDIRCGLLCDINPKDNVTISEKRVGVTEELPITATEKGLSPSSRQAVIPTTSSVKHQSVGITEQTGKVTEELIKDHGSEQVLGDIDSAPRLTTSFDPDDVSNSRDKRSTREGIGPSGVGTIGQYKSMMQNLTSIDFYANVTSSEGGVCERARLWVDRLAASSPQVAPKPNNLGIRKLFSRGRDVKDKMDIFTDYQCGIAIWGATLSGIGQPVFWALTPSIYMSTQDIRCSPASNCKRSDVLYSCQTKCECVVHTLIWGEVRTPITVNINKGNCRRQVVLTQDFADKVCPMGVTMYKSKIVYPGSYTYTPNSKLCFDGNFTTAIEDGNFSECLSLNENFNYAKCPMTPSNEKACKAELSEVNWDTVIIHITVNNKQMVSYPREGKLVSSECDKSCLIEATRELEIVVSCSNGLMSVVRAPVRIQSDCGWWISHLSTTLSEPICRMGEHRIWLLLTLIFLFFGWAASIIGLLSLSYFLGCCRVCYRNVRVNLHKDNRVCKDCGECVCFKELVANHEFCDHGLCPYCSATIGAGLKDHAKHCPSKSTVMGSIKEKVGREVNANRRGVLRLQSCLWNPWSWGLVWFASFVILLIMSAVSVSAQAQEPFYDQAHSRFTLLKQTVQGCQYSAGFKKGVCQAKDTEVMARFKRYSDPDSIKKELMESSISVLPGDLSKSIYESKRILGLSVTGRVNTQDGELLEGNVLMDFPIRPNVGSIIEIGDGSSFEKRRVTLSILETQQIYSYRFLYYTSDRQISTVDEWSCSGSCASICKCSLNGCKTLRIDDALNAGCDTVDCWKLNSGGCVCCKMYLESVASSTIWSVWETDYQNTEIIMCLGTNSELSKCFISEEGKTVTIDDFEIQLTRVYGVDRKLPGKIALVHNRKPKGNIQMTVPDHILLDPNICYESTCRHGEIGDIQYDRLGYSMNPSKYSNQGRWDISGVTVDKVCGVLWKDVSCRYNNLIGNITEQFSKVERTSKHLNDTFHIHESESTAGMANVPKLRLDVRPLQGGGIVQLKLTTSGHELRRLSEKIEMSIFEIEGCSGCIGCITAGSCAIKHALKTPERTYIHIKSCTDGFVVQADSLLSQVEVSVSNITYFTQLNFSEICLKVEETDDIRKTTKLSQWNAESKILLERGIVIEGSVKKSNSEPEEKGFWASIGSFFKSIGSVFVSWWGVVAAVFSSWKTILVIFTVIIVVLILRFFGFFTILKAIFSVCRRRTAVSFSKRKAELKKGSMVFRQMTKDNVETFKGRMMNKIHSYGEKKQT
uniref:Glycoprotein n=1 Tax=Periplaneta americana nairovirus 3 TaxID=3133472 RepID=A0AAT9JAF5_9VIRU